MSYNLAFLLLITALSDFRCLLVDVFLMPWILSMYRLDLFNETFAVLETLLLAVSEGKKSNLWVTIA